MALHHHVVSPIERDCICPQRPAAKHTQECDDGFRAKFFGAWSNERERFYRAAADSAAFELLGDAPVMN